MTIQSIKRKNELYLEKMELTDQFVTLHEKLRNELSLASLCISKAKTTHGISLFGVNSVDTHDLETSVRVEVDNGKFKIVSEPEENKTKEEAEENKDEQVSTEKKTSGKSEDVEEDSEEKKSPFSGQFRPFGVLECSAAKDARKIYKNAIQTIVDLVSTQQSIISKSRELTADN